VILERICRTFSFFSKEIQTPSTAGRSAEKFSARQCVCLAQMALNVEAVRDALVAFEAAIQGINLSEIVRTEINADIDTIRAQLAKPSPNVNIVKETGAERSRGNCLGLMTPAVTAAALALWSTLGL
jgi:hypothetical protein